MRSRHVAYRELGQLVECLDEPEGPEIEVRMLAYGRWDYRGVG
jgi:hypothetical protein